jgi:hypothetical protein
MMREEDYQLLFLNAVLHLGIGESHAMREPGRLPCTIHRYRDGWDVLIDSFPGNDKRFISNAILGWHFPKAEDIADFIWGAPASYLGFFMIVGTPQ